MSPRCSQNASTHRHDYINNDFAMTSLWLGPSQPRPRRLVGLPPWKNYLRKNWSYLIILEWEKNWIAWTCSKQHKSFKFVSYQSLCLCHEFLRKQLRRTCLECQLKEITIYHNAIRMPQHETTVNNTSKTTRRKRHVENDTYLDYLRLNIFILIIWRIFNGGTSLNMLKIKSIKSWTYLSCFTELAWVSFLHVTSDASGIVFQALMVKLAAQFTLICTLRVLRQFEESAVVMSISLNWRLCW